MKVCCEEFDDDELGLDPEDEEEEDCEDEEELEE